jgi:DNA topoisomerase-1
MFINVNKKYNFDHLSTSDIETLIEHKLQKDRDKVVHDWKDEGIRVEKARWGRHHILQGKKKVEIGKEIDASTLTLEQAKVYLGPTTKAKKKKG